MYGDMTLSRPFSWTLKFVLHITARQEILQKKIILGKLQCPCPKWNTNTNIGGHIIVRRKILLPTYKTTQWLHVKYWYKDKEPYNESIWNTATKMRGHILIDVKYRFLHKRPHNGWNWNTDTNIIYIWTRRKVYIYDMIWNIGKFHSEI